MKSPQFQTLRAFHIFLFNLTAIGKLLDVPGFAAVIDTYQFGIPPTLLLPLAWSVCLFELMAAALLISNKRPVLAAIVCVAAHVFYTLLALVSLLRGLELKNCGCFGVFWPRPLTWQTPIEDLVLTMISLWFLWSATRYKAAR